jgi:hypothetical protein
LNIRAVVFFQLYLGAGLLAPCSKGLLPGLLAQHLASPTRLYFRGRFWRRLYFA